jgi:hypothetical protein
MTAKIPGSLCIAGTLAFALTAVAQGQQPAQPQAQASAQASSSQVTVTGCIQREADYRKARDAGRGGAAGTGVGAGNEFVLTEAKPAAGAKDTSSPAGTTGTSASGSMAYELTGPNEGQLTQHVGRRVEITGRLKPAETDASGRPTGGATAGQPPAGVDATSKDLKLRELEVISVRESTGTCSPMK